MNRRALIGILALIPAALNVAPASGHGLTVALCTGDGIARSVTIPVPGSDNGPPGREVPGCCAKACHTGSRKKSHCRQIDT